MKQLDMFEEQAPLDVDVYLNFYNLGSGEILKLDKLKSGDQIQLKNKWYKKSDVYIKDIKTYVTHIEITIYVKE